jgi:hypothetical protein
VSAGALRRLPRRCHQLRRIRRSCRRLDQPRALRRHLGLRRHVLAPFVLKRGDVPHGRARRFAARQ